VVPSGKNVEMRDHLAERLLAAVMQWSPEQVAHQRPRLQAIAEYKYDEYQQFSPGMRFVESLALWLSQFGNHKQRQAAYDFVMQRLVFISTAEMNHFVAIAYPEVLRPELLRLVAAEAGFPQHQVSRNASSKAFRIRQRRTLFLGLSDGAKIDVFRRQNSPDLSHDQILRSHEISQERKSELLKDLKYDLKKIGVKKEERFKTLILLDDFSGSGRSYWRQENERVKGKIGRLLDDTELIETLFERPFELHVLLYSATEKACKYLNDALERHVQKIGGSFKLHVVQLLGEELSLQPETAEDLAQIIEKHYDCRIEDAHTRKGNTDLRYGFAGCGLPLVLSHNSPNNSLALLWSETEKVRALFRRVSRHSEES
jgi:hypothetical protein